MRTISAALDAVLTAEGGTCAKHVRVLIDSDGAGTFQDMTNLQEFNWVDDVSWDDNDNQQFAKATVKLAKRLGSLSLATLMTGSALNDTNTLVEINRDIKIETATLPRGVVPVEADWEEQFNGGIESIDTSGYETIKLDCLNDQDRLVSKFIETVQVYPQASPPDPVEDAMQEILDDNLTVAPTLFVPTSPSFEILEFKQARESVATALRKLAQQIGHDVRYRWDNGTSAFRLTLIAPARANLLSTDQQGAEAAPTGYTAIDSATLAANTANVYQGDQSLSIITAAAVNSIKGGALASITGVAATAYSGYVWLKADSGTPTIEVYLRDDTNSIESSKTSVTLNSSTFTQAKVTGLTSGTGTPTIQIRVEESVADSNITFYADKWNLEGVLPDRTFGPNQYYVPTQSAISRAGVRNRIQVVYTDASTGIRTTYTAFDQESIDRYGTLFMQITEGATSQIDSIAEAQDLAEAALADLKDPTLDYSVPMPYFSPIQLGDLYRFSANDEDFDTDTDLAVAGFTHRFSKGKEPQTVVQTRGKPGSGVARWFEVEGRSGGAAAADDLIDSAADNVAGDSDGGLLIVTYDDPRTMSPPISDWAYTVCHVSTSGGFTPGPSTEVQRGKITRFEIAGLVPGTTYFVKLQIIDESGNISLTSTQISKAIAFIGPRHLNPDATYNESIIRNPYFSSFFNDDDADPPEGWNMGVNSVWVESSPSGSEWSDSTSSNLSGGRSLRNTAENPDPTGDPNYVVESDFAPCQEGQILYAEVVFKRASGDGNGLKCLFQLEYFEEDKTTQVTIDTISFNQGSGSGNAWINESGVDPELLTTSANWYAVREFQVVPVDARYVRAVVTKERQGTASSNDVNLFIDRFVVREVTDVWDADTFSTVHNVDASSFTAFDLSDENEDRSGSGSPGSGQWTAPRDTSVVAHIAARTTGLTAGNSLFIRVRKNTTVVEGASIGPATRVAGTSTTGASLITSKISVVAGDTITAQLKHDEGSAIDVEEAMTVLEVTG